MKRQILSVIVAFTVALALAGCGGADEEGPASEIANPASEFCVEQGGTLEIREGEGGQVGVCVFDDGSECEEWAFYRGECSPGGEG
jgi:putative hemolysin